MTSMEDVIEQIRNEFPQRNEKTGQYINKTRRVMLEIALDHVRNYQEDKRPKDPTCDSQTRYWYNHYVKLFSELFKPNSSE